MAEVTAQEKRVQATKFRSGRALLSADYSCGISKPVPVFPYARFARMSVQLMKKLLQGYKFAGADLGATLADGPKFGLGGLNNWRSAFEVPPPGFAQELRAGTVFLLWTRSICLTMAGGREMVKVLVVLMGVSSVLLVVT